MDLTPTTNVFDYFVRAFENAQNKKQDKEKLLRELEFQVYADNLKRLNEQRIEDEKFNKDLAQLSEGYITTPAKLKEAEKLQQSTNNFTKPYDTSFLKLAIKNIIGKSKQGAQENIPEVAQAPTVQSLLNPSNALAQSIEKENVQIPANANTTSVEVPDTLVDYDKAQQYIQNQNKVAQDQVNKYDALKQGLNVLKTNLAGFGTPVLQETGIPGKYIMYLKGKSGTVKEIDATQKGTTGYLYDTATGNLIEVPYNTRIFTPPGASVNLQSANRIAAFKQTLNEFKNAVKNLPADGRISGHIVQMLNTATGAFPEVKQVNGIGGVMVPMITRILGGDVGNLSENEQKAAQKLTSMVTMTAEERELILKTLEDLVAIKEAALKQNPNANFDSVALRNILPKDLMPAYQKAINTLAGIAPTSNVVVPNQSTSTNENFTVEEAPEEIDAF